MGKLTEQKTKCANCGNELTSGQSGPCPKCGQEGKVTSIKVEDSLTFAGGLTFQHDREFLIVDKFWLTVVLALMVFIPIIFYYIGCTYLSGVSGLVVNYAIGSVVFYAGYRSIIKIKKTTTYHEKS